MGHNFLIYGNQVPVNISLVEILYKLNAKQNIHDKPIIVFKFKSTKELAWKFKQESERNEVYSLILSKVNTTILNINTNEKM